MPGCDTARLPATRQGVARAAALLRDGATVAFPTETVYGLGADATNARAVAAVYAAKGRPAFNPLIVHVADLDTARGLAVFSDAAERLAAAFWPGPLTLVLPLNADAGLSSLVTAGLGSVAVRVPAHPLAREVLRAAAVPVAAPSANPSGRISPTRAAHVLDGLGGRIAAVLDGGSCGVGLESTIVGLTGAPRLLRPGGLPAEALAECLGGPLPMGGDPAAPDAPGQLPSHYAPRGRVRMEAAYPLAREVFIGFGPTGGMLKTGGTLNLSASGDLVEAAANLFDMLHAADARAGPGGTIAVAPVPDRGLGRAINDRLRRAAAPRISASPMP